MTNEELLLTAQHIEQNRHASYLPDPYYLEGLKRDSDDSRINNAYGMLMLRRGKFAEAETCFRKAVKRLTWRCPITIWLPLRPEGEIWSRHWSWWKRDL